MTKRSIIESLKQILREADESPSGNWAHANLVVRAQALAVPANDPLYRRNRLEAVGSNAKKSAIVA